MKTLFTLALMTLSLPALAGSSEDTFDRALSRSEMQRLLPLYVAKVESQAAVLPSPEERRIMLGIAFDIEDPIYYAFDQNNKVIGRQSHTAEEITKGIESSLAELKQITPEQRLREAADLLAGFKGAGDAGKIRCTLGYEKGYKAAHSRIVKCEDNRSVSGKGGDDEGYYDVRSFILSIDAKTLEPVSTLRLDHVVAG